MTEAQDIVNASCRLAPGQRAALATIVSLEGSSYRRPGARMLITDNGETTGALSAGCFEQDVCERAMKVMLTGEPALVKYDTTTDDDIVWGLGLGCSGVVHILIEPATNERVGGLMQLLDECAQSDLCGAIATVFRANDRSIGAAAFLYPDGTIDGQMIAPSIYDDLREVVRNGNSIIKRYESTDVFLEVVRPPVRLLILGADHDVSPVVRLAKGIGWHTSVVDTRARATSLERFKEADAVWLCRPEDVGKQVPLSQCTAVVLMTHNYLHDLELLRQLLPLRLRYLGCLGPKKRTERLLLDLATEDTWFVKSNLRRLHAPVGLDIGAETAEEIALSIVSEIKAVLSERAGGQLRQRDGSIHDWSTSLMFAVRTVVEMGHPVADLTATEVGFCEV